MRVEHPHQYVRVKLSPTYYVFKCLKAGCKHYINVKLVLGHLAECCVCKDTFTMTVKSATLRRPHCVNCVRRPDKLSKRNAYKLSDCSECGTKLTNPSSSGTGLCSECISKAVEIKEGE